MGEEVVEYENSRLEGINDLKTFSRLLSMNHSELIGHQALEDWDISIINDNRGKNVGDRVKMDDVLRVSSI
ncbi:MAG: hypothetical protein J6R59_02695 [Paludibacteraceae bacterium]|nr:hypothetical protein [Paludibacteraceae bacterium]